MQMSPSERMFVDAVKNYLSQFPGVAHKVDLETGTIWVEAGDDDLRYEIYDRIDDLIEYYGVEDYFS